MSKVAVTDFTFDKLDVEEAILRPLGCEVVGQRCKTPEELIALVGDADFVITQFAPVKAAVIEAMQRAKIIVRYGIGVDNVDLAAAKKQNIPVCNIPDYCIDEVADHTLALLLNATRAISQSGAVVARGEWKMAVQIEAMRALAGGTVGVVGFGRIGREVAKRLLAFKCRVLVSDPAVNQQDIAALGCQAATFEEICKSADAITLHCPSNDHTRKIINSQSLAKMKKGVTLINVGRGDLVETPALIEALKSGQVRAAGLDVTDPEPIQVDSPLRKFEQVTITPHIASVSVKAVRALRESVANTVACAVRGEKLPNVVNGVG